MKGYKTNAVGSKCAREMKIIAFTRDFNLPEAALPILSGRELSICLQTPDDVIYLTGHSEQEREALFRHLSHHLTAHMSPTHFGAGRAGMIYHPPNRMHSNDYDRYYGLSKGVPKRARSNTNLLEKEMYFPRPIEQNESVEPDYTYVKSKELLDNEMEKESVYGEEYGSVYESIPYSFPSRSLPPVPPKDCRAKNRPGGRVLGCGCRLRPRSEQSILFPDNIPEDKNECNFDIISEGSSVDRVETLRPIREPEANIAYGSDTPEYLGALRSKEESPLCGSPSNLEFVETFRRQHFKRRHTITLSKPTMNWKAVRLSYVKDEMLMIAGLPDNLYNELHVGDVITKVNNNALPFKDRFYELIESTNSDEVEVEISRVPHGCFCHVTLKVIGGIEFLGLSFSDCEKQGVEITAIDEDGLVFKSHQLQYSCPVGVKDSTKRVNWGLVEINQKPVPLDSSKQQVEYLLRNAGTDLALVLLPMDLILHLRDSVL
ncbi:uncharacterized protein LOC135155544 [Lytechinus pictus]|uniref:uncharacterized protein LOC135155544 n=1 Tax=Lytechinus pictus TaxID=7653 RepID=UPI0030B9BBB1